MRVKRATAGAMLTLLLGAAATVLASPPDASQKKKTREATVPEAATEGPRDPAKLVPPLKKFVATQPYGKTWKELVHQTPAPKDRRGLGDAKSHPDLKHDQIEMQAQVQYLEETGAEARFGWVSIRGVRVYRFGRLAAVQLLVDRIGKGAAQDGAFEADLKALAEQWSHPGKALELPKGYRIKRNELAEVRVGGAKPKLPLTIAIEPPEGTPQ